MLRMSGHALPLSLPFNSFGKVEHEGRPLYAEAIESYDGFSLPSACSIGIVPDLSFIAWP